MVWLTQRASSLCTLLYMQVGQPNWSEISWTMVEAGRGMVEGECRWSVSQLDRIGWNWHGHQRSCWGGPTCCMEGDPVGEGCGRSRGHGGTERVSPCCGRSDDTNGSRDRQYSGQRPDKESDIPRTATLYRPCLDAKRGKKKNCIVTVTSNL
jgi:hypothetical protein